jgi:L-seryl-tRNA(Ser) seleniumtransferase
VVADVGSGLLAPAPELSDEPDAATWLRAGAQLVTASGDKLLGGPQAGLVLGEATLVGRLRRHPLYRALRVDKLTLAALEATLVGPQTPVHRALTANPAVLERRAATIATSLTERGVPCTSIPSDGVVGGGGAPGVALPGWAVQLPVRFADALRRGEPPVVARVEKHACLLDLRCVPVEDDDALCAAVLRAAAGVERTSHVCT